MKFILILLFILPFRIAEAKDEDSRDPAQVIRELLKEEKYEEAEKYLADKPQISSSFWAMPTVERSKKCSLALKSCGTEFIHLQDVYKCRQSIGKSCPDNGLSEKVQSNMNDILQRADDIEIPLKPFSIYGKQCEDGFKWGYAIHKKLKSCIQCASSLSEDMKKLTGEFSNKEQCEEARILADEKSKFTLSDSCLKRYLGENKSISFWKTKVMNLDRPESSVFIQDSFELFFETSEKCEKSISNGMKFYSLESEVNIGPINSSSKNRFITQCKAIKIPLCSKFKQETEKLPEQVL